MTNIIIAIIIIFFISALIFILFKKIKDSNKISNWLKNGLFGGVIAVFYLIIIYLFEGFNCGIPHKGTMCGFFTMLANYPSFAIISLIPHEYLSILILPTVNFILGFIVGVLIGGTIRKIKLKNK